MGKGAPGDLWDPNCSAVGSWWDQPPSIQLSSDELHTAGHGVKNLLPGDPKDSPAQHGMWDNTVTAAEGLRVGRDLWVICSTLSFFPAGCLSLLREPEVGLYSLHLLGWQRSLQQPSLDSRLHGLHMWAVRRYLGVYPSLSCLCLPWVTFGVPVWNKAWVPWGYGLLNLLEG